MTWMLFYVSLIAGPAPLPPEPGYPTRAACERAAAPRTDVRVMCLPIASR